jgi:long-chain acyl-CoA synthetase
VTVAAPHASALQAQTLSEALRLTARRRGQAPAICDEGLGEDISWAEYDRLVDRVAESLRGNGCRPGETIAILLRNRWEFHVLDAGAMRAGIATVSLYNAAAESQRRQVLADSGARWLFGERALLHDRTALPAEVERVTLVDDAAASDVPLAELTSEREGTGEAPAVAADDLLCLVYTSGATGEAKGVEIDHRAALRGARAFLDAIPMQPDGHVVSYLPMAHVAERACSHYMPMLLGTTVHCCRDPKEVFAVLPQVRPTFFFSVPRLWEKMAETIRERIGSQPEEVRTRFESGDEELVAALRSLLGLDRARHLVVGAAATPPGVLRFFDRLGLPLLETWGMTELCAVATANRLGRRRLGSVGQPVGDVALRIAADGEVLVKTEARLRAYRNRPEETRALVDADGWLRTGDLGALDDDGFLTVTGRKKELIVTAQGKNVSPQLVERALAEEMPFAGQVCCVGSERPYLVAIVAAGGEAEVPVAEVQRGVERASRRLGRSERPRRVLLTEAEWTPESGLITPTHKLRRSQIERHYAAELEALYAASASGPEEVLVRRCGR